MEKEFTDLGILFQNIICDLKGSYPLWEDLIKQCGKFNSTLRLVIAGMSSFLDSFQKLADFAMETKGGPRDLGSSMIKLCLRHKALENHLKSYTNSLVECLVVPLQEKMDEWRRNALQLDKEHGKECKKMHGEVKKASLETAKLQKKVNKGKPDAKSKLELCTRDYNAKASALELTERNAILSAITEHRSRFAFLVGCIKPVMAHETAMMGELESFRDIMTILEAQSSSGPGIIEQTFVDAIHGFHMTIERKKRSIKEEADFMGTMSRSSSSSSHKSNEAFLKNGCPENPSVTNHNSSSAGHYVGRSSTLPYTTRAPSDTVQQSPIVTMTVDDNFFFRQEFVPVERTRTISPEEHPQVSVRPNLTADTFVPPPAVQQQQMQHQQIQQQHQQMQHQQMQQQQQIQQQQMQQQQLLQQFSRQQSFPSSTSLSSTSSTLSSSSGSKKVEKIYARPALVKRENSIVTPVFVAPPTVPDLPGIKLKQNDKKETADISSLNQVILDLEKNAKLLETSHPTTSLQSLQSLQSMQCSSGYGTMTNVSSNETMQSIAELDALLESSLTDLEKCSTLPLKRFNHSRMEADNRRPVSTSDEVPNNNSIWQNQLQNGQQHLVQGRYGNTNPDELPPPPDDLLRPQQIVDNKFPPPPASFNHSVSHQHHYHQPQILQQKELNMALRQRFSQLHQNLDALPENHHSSQLRVKADDDRPASVCPVHRRADDGGSSDASDEPQGFSALLRGVSLRKTIVNDRSAPVLKRI